MAELKEPIEEEPKRPEPTEEELAKSEIMKADDGEQLRCQKLSEHGTPVAWIIYRSKKLDKQVLEVPEYNEVKRDDELIGYARQGSTLTIQAYGEETETELVKREG